MACSLKGYKAFLVCCNVMLLFVGLALLIFGLKMKWTVESLLMSVPVIAKAFKALIATGFFISVTGIIGIAGASYEILWLILVHLIFLAVIVTMEFALGVTLVVIRTTIEGYIESPECNNSCAATLDVVVLDYALPSTGLMMTIIIVEAMMIYCAVKLYYHIRDVPKTDEVPVSVTRTLQMLDVSMAQSSFLNSPRPGYSPHVNYSPRAHPAGYFNHHHPPSPYSSPRSSPKPPEYSEVSEQLPPPYFEVVPTVNRSPTRGIASIISRSPRSPRFNPA